MKKKNWVILCVICIIIALVFIIKSSKELKIKYSSEYIDSLLNLSGSYLASNIPEKSIAYFNLIKQNLYP